MQDGGPGLPSLRAPHSFKVFLTATLTQKSLMIAMLQRVLSSHQAVMNGDDKSAPAHVLRCIKRILGAIRAESRAGSPHLGEAEAGMDMTLEEMFGQFVRRGESEPARNGAKARRIYSHQSMAAFRTLRAMSNSGKRDDCKGAEVRQMLFSAQ